jgi:hypothetical protein
MRSRSCPMPHNQRTMCEIALFCPATSHGADVSIPHACRQCGTVPRNYAIAKARCGQWKPQIRALALLDSKAKPEGEGESTVIGDEISGGVRTGVRLPSAVWDGEGGILLGAHMFSPVSTYMAHQNLGWGSVGTRWLVARETGCYRCIRRAVGLPN